MMCPNCFGEQDFDGVGTSGQNLVRCQSCGFEFEPHDEPKETVQSKKGKMF